MILGSRGWSAAHRRRRPTAQRFRGIQSRNTDAVTHDGLVLDADDPPSAAYGRRSDSKFAQLMGDLSVEALLVLTVARRNQPRRENRCRPQSLHVRHPNSQNIAPDYETVACERQHLGDKRRWQPQSEARAPAEQEPSMRTIDATKEM
jgi:hypothetical protein